MSSHLAKSLSTVESIWQATCTIIKEHINTVSFNTWFQPTKAISISDTHIEISVPNHFFSEWIEKHYSKLVQNAITQVLGENKKLKYIVGNVEAISNSPYNVSDWQQTPKTETTISYNKLEDSPYFSKTNERYTFENYIVGDGNSFAHAAAQAVATSPGTSNYNPLFIYGPTGLGKTHLIQAIGNYALQKEPSTRVFYASSETFTQHYVTSIQQKKISEFSAFYRSCDILLLDDVHFFQNKGRTQEELFHTFNDLQQNGKQIILTADRPINELEDLEDRLISRFKAGLITDIEPPDYETRLAILRKKCDDNSLSISGDILEYMAVNLKSNIRELEGALTKIMAKVTFTSAEPTLEVARNIISEIAKPDKSILTIDTIMDHVANVFNVSIDQIRAKTRKKDIVRARQAAMYLAKQLTDHSLVTIGLHFGGRDHSTVIHGIESVEQLIRTDAALRARLITMKKHLEYNK
jgi:chromosomal replication initiator protein